MNKWVWRGIRLEWLFSQAGFPSMAWGITAIPGRRMGHARAIITGGKDTTVDKMAPLEAAGVRVVKTPPERAEMVKSVLG